MTAAPAATGYVAISRRTLDVEDYIDLARRHVGWIAGPMLAGLVISTVVAFALPNVYISQAELQITPAQVSDAIVKSAVNGGLTERILLMQNEIESRTSLSNIIQDPRLNLYKSELASRPLEDVIDMMRKDIHIKIESLTAGEGTHRASAFSISFEYPDRIKARDTVQNLITKFQDSNLTTQRTQYNTVNTFVHDEVSEAKAKLDSLNEELTKFRVENSGKLPEQSTMNIAQLTALQQQMTSINESLNREATEKLQLDTRLQTLQSQLQLYDMYEKEPGAATPIAKLQNQQLEAMNRNIENAELNLQQLEKLYKPGYPDIRDAETRLAEMKTQREVLQKKQDDDQAKLNEALKNATPKKSTDVALVQRQLTVTGQINETKTAIESKEMDRGNLIKEQGDVNKRIDAYQAKLAAASGIEATYNQMISSQRAASEKYQTLMSQQQLTEQNGELLQRKAGENLDVLDPPSLPQQPAAPKRWMIIGAGTAIGFILGLALAGLQEAKDTSLKNLKDVRAYTNLPVLSSIPLLENTMLVRRKRRIAYLAWSAAVIVGIMAVTASLYYHMTQV